MRMIEIGDGLAFIPAPGCVLKRADDKCVLYTPGQSALEGFVVDRDYDELLDEINEALEDEDGV
jgi:hypothetical protein